MSGILSISTLSWALRAFFVLGFVINTFAVKLVGPEYQRWGFPDWFHFVTGGLELVVALLLPLAMTRLFGVALGAAVMVAAIATVIHHHEFHRAVPPFVVLVLLAIVGWTLI
jgi:xanthine/uracil permease